MLLSTLDNLWNHHIVPISSLPETLLSEILIEAVEDDPIERLRSIEKGWKQRVCLSSVCRSWRIVALECPAFWAGLRLHLGCKGLSKMIPRWQNYSRAIYISLGISERKFSLSRDSPPPKLLIVGDRLADLKMLGAGEFFEEAWKVWPKNWDLKLHSLDLQCMGLSMTCAPLPSHLIQSFITPALRNLSLHNFAVEWEALDPLLALGDRGGHILFADLTSLLLSELYPPPSGALINHILSSAQRLDSLAIEHSFPHGFEPTFRWQSPCLTDLRLIDSFENVGKTFLKIPCQSMSKYIRIQLTAIGCDPDDSTLWPESDPAPMAQLADDVLNRFATIISKPGVFEGDKRLFVSEQRSHFSIRVLDPVEDLLDFAPLSMKIDYFQRGFDLESFSPFARICVPEVENVWLDIGRPGDQDVANFRQFFNNHPRIATLNFTANYHSQLIKVIRLLSPSFDLSDSSPMGSTDSEANASDAILLPALHTLSLQEVETHLFVDELESMLFARWQAGCPIALVENVPFGIQTKLDRKYVEILQSRIPSHVTRFEQRSLHPSASHSSEGEDDEPEEYVGDQWDEEGYRRSVKRK